MHAKKRQWHAGGRRKGGGGGRKKGRQANLPGKGKGEGQVVVGRWWQAGGELQTVWQGRVVGTGRWGGVGQVVEVPGANGVQALLQVVGR